MLATANLAYGLCQPMGLLLIMTAQKEESVDDNGGCGFSEHRFEYVADSPVWYHCSSCTHGH